MFGTHVIYHEKNLKIHLNYKYLMLKLNQGL